MSVVDVTVKSILIVIATHFVWRVAQRVFARSPLDNVPGPPPASFLTGHLPHYFDRHGTEFQRDVAHKYGSVVRMQGMFGQPLLYIYDPRALHTMFVREQSTYDEEELSVKRNEHSALWARLNLGSRFAACSGHETVTFIALFLGEQHRKQRKMLNSLFSVAHMRDMTPILYNVAGNLRDAFLLRVRDGPRELDMLNWMGRAALESIAQGGIGTSIDPLTRDTPDAYASALKAVLPTLSGLELLRYLLLVLHICEIGPAWFRQRLVHMIPHKGLQKMKDVVGTATRKSVEIYEAKKAALQQGEEETSRQVAEGKGILSTLMRANMAAYKDDKFSEDELTAQMTIFLFAATDTTSNSMVRIIERLAQNEGIQNRLRTEVIKAQSAGRLSYDDLMRLPILDAVIRETLRVDPLTNMVIRQPTKDIILPLSQPIQGIDGTLINEIPIARGTPIIIGALGSNTNKALWGEDALEWKPERWLSPLPSAVTEASIPGVYSNLMTFLAGSRACIGFKFSELEMKVILAVMLSTFRFELTDKPVVWNVAPVRYPTVGTESTYAEMPMKVSLL